VLGLSRASRAKWEEDAKEIGEIDQKLKDELYGEAVAVTRQLAAAQTKESAKEDRKEFWRLYYGALVLVESPEIEGAMVGFGNALNEWTTEGPPHTGLRLAKLADKLKQQVDIEVKGRSTE
jgi:hypothetical protein